MNSCDRLTPVYYYRRVGRRNRCVPRIIITVTLIIFFRNYYGASHCPCIYSSLSLLFLFVLSCSRSVTPFRHNIYFLLFSVTIFPEISINRPGRAKDKISIKETSVEYILYTIYMHNTS